MIVPHPYHVVMHLERRHADFLDESARAQRARLAERVSTSPSWSTGADVLGALIAIVVLTLLVAAATAAFIAPASASSMVAEALV